MNLVNHFLKLGNSTVPNNSPEIWYYCPSGVQHATGYLYDRLQSRQRAENRNEKKQYEPKGSKVQIHDGWSKQEDGICLNIHL